MPRTKKPKRSEAQRRADKNYADKNRKNQKENFKNIAATLPRAEAEYISAIFKAHGVKPSEIIRGAAAALRDGQPICTESEPLTIPQEADGESDSTDTPPQE